MQHHTGNQNLHKQRRLRVMAMSVLVILLLFYAVAVARRQKKKKKKLLTHDHMNYQTSSQLASPVHTSPRSDTSMVSQEVDVHSPHLHVTLCTEDLTVMSQHPLLIDFGQEILDQIFLLQQHPCCLYHSNKNYITKKPANKQT